MAITTRQMTMTSESSLDTNHPDEIPNALADFHMVAEHVPRSGACLPSITSPPHPQRQSHPSSSLAASSLTSKNLSRTNGDHLGDPYDLPDHLWKDPSRSPGTAPGGYPPSATDDQLDIVYGHDSVEHRLGSPPLLHQTPQPRFPPGVTPIAASLAQSFWTPSARQVAVPAAITTTAAAGTQHQRLLHRGFPAGVRQR